MTARPIKTNDTDPIRIAAVELEPPLGRAPKKGVCPDFGVKIKTIGATQGWVGFEPRDTESPATKVDTFHWTSPEKEARVVVADRQIDLHFDLHAKRPASVQGLWWC